MNKMIMIVDDCSTTRKIISLYLRGAGYKTILATNGVEAIETLVGNDIDFIITDLNMPQMDGIELTRWIRSNEAFKDLPLVILTTENDDLTRVKGLNTGATAFLTKPISKDKLVEEVKKIKIVE